MAEYIDKQIIVGTLVRVIKYGIRNKDGSHDITAEEMLEVVNDVPVADVMERPRWHSVVEAPPLSVGDSDYYGYLVYSCGYVRVADFTGNEFHVDGEYDPDVTHWMPIPQPPEEENND